MTKLITILLLVFMCIGIVDKVFFHGKYGYGAPFDEGFAAMGPLALAMLGIMCGAPVLGRLLTPIMTPVFRIFQANPAMLAGSILAPDMGGYPLACSMTQDPYIQMFSGIILASMMGSTICFSIPIALSIVEKKDEGSVARGFLIGFVAIPFGALAGGALAGVQMNIVLINLIPAIIISLFLVLGLWVSPKKTLACFRMFSKALLGMIHIFFAFAVIETLLGITVMGGMAPLTAQAEVVLLVVVTLSGAYPFIRFLTVVLNEPLKKLSGKLGVSVIAISGMLACLANNIPLFYMLKDIPQEEKELVVAFSVCASFAFGDYLGYVQAQIPELMIPMITGKLIAAMLAVVICKTMKKIIR